MSPPEEPTGRSSFWTSLPGVLTGAAALITAIVGALALLRSGEAPAVDPASPPAATGQPGSAAGSPAGFVGSSAVEAPDAACYASYLANVPADHRKALAAGAADVVLIGPAESKRGVFAVRLGEGDQALGVLRFSLRVSDETFHIEQMVDASCRPVADVANAYRPDQPSVLQNWDEVRIRMGGSAYLIRLGYSGGEVSVGYFRRIVE